MVDCVVVGDVATETTALRVSDDAFFRTKDMQQANQLRGYMDCCVGDQTPARPPGDHCIFGKGDVQSFGAVHIGLFRREKR